METKIIWFGLGLGVVAIFLRVIRSKIKGKWLEKYHTLILDWVDTLLSAVILAALIMNFVVQAFKIPSGSMRPTLIEGDHLFVNKFIYGLRIPFTERRILSLDKVKRGDIIIFSCPPVALSPLEREKGVRKDFIKRCIAVSGDIVEVQNKRVYLNGKEILEPYVMLHSEIVYPAMHFVPNPVQFSQFPEQENYQKAWEEGRFAQLGGGTVRDNFGPVQVPTGCYFVMGDNRDASFDSRFWGPLADKYLKGRALLLYWPIKRIRIIK